MNYDGWKKGDHAYMYHRGLSLWEVRLIDDPQMHHSLPTTVRVQSVRIPGMTWTIDIDSLFEERPAGCERTPGYNLVA